MALKLFRAIMAIDDVLKVRLFIGRNHMQNIKMLRHLI